MKTVFDFAVHAEFGAVARVLAHAVLLHEVREMDNAAWLVEFKDGNRAILTTSDGALYVAGADELRKKLDETEKSAKSIRKLLKRADRG